MAVGTNFSGGWRKRWRQCAWIGALVMVLAGQAGAQSAPDAGFRAFLEALKPEAFAAGVSEATFARSFKGITPDRSLPDLAPASGGVSFDARGQAEFSRTPAQYLDETQISRLAEEGRALARTHGATLAAIRGQLQVDPSVLLAIWGRETAYGRFKLRHNLMRVLATQAYLGRRKEMFRKELIAALRMVEDGVIDPAKTQASWAGALGLTQFMPSEYYELAVDMDKDGKKDIWTSVPDALASAANQLRAKGWTLGQPWGFEVVPPRADACLLEGPWNRRPLADWIKQGFQRVDRKPPDPRLLATEAFLLTPGGSHGPAFLVFENFLVLKRYNFADLYAVFVGNLGDRIGGGGAFSRPWNTPAMISNADIADIQGMLTKRGYAIEKVDGKAGMNTRSLIGKFQRESGATVDCWPGAGVLAQLRRKP